MNVIRIKNAALSAPFAVAALVFAAVSFVPASSVAGSGGSRSDGSRVTACCARPAAAPAVASTPGGKGDYLVTVGKRSVWASQAVVTTGNASTTAASGRSPAARTKAASSCCSGGNCCAKGNCCSVVGCCKADKSCCDSAKGVCTAECGCPTGGCCGDKADKQASAPRANHTSATCCAAPAAK